jgi:hypothetical protein
MLCIHSGPFCWSSGLETNIDNDKCLVGYSDQASAFWRVMRNSELLRRSSPVKWRLLGDPTLSLEAEASWVLLLIAFPFGRERLAYSRMRVVLSSPKSPYRCTSWIPDRLCLSPCAIQASTRAVMRKELSRPQVAILVSEPCFFFSIADSDARGGWEPARFAAPETWTIPIGQAKHCRLRNHSPSVLAKIVKHAFKSRI